MVVNCLCVKTIFLTLPQELEIQLVREVLEVFIRVCIFVDQPTFLGFVFRAISSRLDYVSTVRPGSLPCSANVNASIS